MVEVKISQQSGYVDNYGIPKFVRRFTLLRHCLNLTPIQKKASESDLNRIRKRYRVTVQQMEESFELGAQLMIHMGSATPMPGKVLSNFNYYKTFFKDV